MAQIVELTIVIKVSEMVKDDGSDRTVKVDQDTLDALETITAELLGDKYLVEAAIGNGE